MVKTGEFGKETGMGVANTESTILVWYQELFLSMQ